MAVFVVFVEASAVVVVVVMVVVVAVVGAVVAVEEAERTGTGDELDISAKSYTAGQKTRTKPRKLKKKLLEIAMLPRHAPTNTFAKDRSKVGCSSNRGENRGPDEGGRR